MIEAEKEFKKNAAAVKHDVGLGIATYMQVSYAACVLNTTAFFGANRRHKLYQEVGQSNQERRTARMCLWIKQCSARARSSRQMMLSLTPELGGCFEGITMRPVAQGEWLHLFLNGVKHCPLSQSRS